MSGMIGGETASAGALVKARAAEVAAAIDRGLEPEDVGRMVRDAVVRDDLYVFTHPEQRSEVAERFDRILAAFDDIEKRGGGAPR